MGFFYFTVFWLALAVLSIKITHNLKQKSFLDNSKNYYFDRIKLLEKTHDENAHFQGKSVQITIAFRIDLLLS